MDIKPLADLATLSISDMIKGKTPEERRKFFNIKDDCPPEEENKRREES
jgi:hypothetical protein